MWSWAIACQGLTVTIEKRSRVTYFTLGSFVYLLVQKDIEQCDEAPYPVVSYRHASVSSWPRKIPIEFFQGNGYGHEAARPRGERRAAQEVKWELGPTRLLAERILSEAGTLGSSVSLGEGGNVMRRVQRRGERELA